LCQCRRHPFDPCSYSPALCPRAELDADLVPKPVQPEFDLDFLGLVLFPSNALSIFFLVSVYVALAPFRFFPATEMALFFPTLWPLGSTSRRAMVNLLSLRFLSVLLAFPSFPLRLGADLVRGLTAYLPPIDRPRIRLPNTPCRASPSLQTSNIDFTPGVLFFLELTNLSGHSSKPRLPFCLGCSFRTRKTNYARASPPPPR